MKYPINPEFTLFEVVAQRSKFDRYSLNFKSLNVIEGFFLSKSTMYLLTTSKAPSEHFVFIIIQSVFKVYCILEYRFTTRVFRCKVHSFCIELFKVK
jgi:hypothetical protein